MLRLVAAGPALAGLGALLGWRLLRRLGHVRRGRQHAGLLRHRDPHRRAGRQRQPHRASPSLLELARLLREEPVSGVRVLLVSTGSEESFMEGMRGWVRRHGPGLDPARTRVVVLETLGSPELILLEGEGMIWMTDYDAGVRELIADAARRAGVALRRGLRLGFATDALSALRGGLPRGDARLLRRVQDARQLPLPARHPAQRRLRHGGLGGPRRRGRDQVSSERARLIASSRVAISPA